MATSSNSGGDLYVQESSGDVTRLTVSENWRTLAWSPDGTQIAAVNSFPRELWLLDAATGDQVEQLTSGEFDFFVGIVWGSQWSPITMSLGDTAGRIGEVVSVPVGLDGVEDLVSGDVTLTYDPAVLSPLRSRMGDQAAAESFLALGTVVEPGQWSIRFVGSGPIEEESGTLMHLDFPDRVERRRL